MGGTAVRKPLLARSSTGFSLVELMVALTIGLIILAATGMLFVSSKKGYSTQDSLAHLQENGRFAIQFIVKDLRLAGYYGCVDDINAESIHSTLNGDTSFDYNAQTPIEGLNGSANTWYPSTSTSLPSGRIAGTDAIMVRMGDPDGSLTVTSEMPNESAEVKVSSVSGFSEGEVVMISDCASADVFQITAVQTASSKLQHAPGGADATQDPPWPGNDTGQGGKLSKAYGPPGSKVMKFYNRQFYIGTGASGNPALFRITNSGTAEELVDGIESIRLLFGKDTDGDKVPNVYLRPGATGLQSASDWSSVVSVRVGLLARTLVQEGTDVDGNLYDLDGDGTNDFPTSGNPPNDRYKRRVFSATVLLRNL